MDSKILSFSPLKGFKTVSFITNHNELTNEIQNYKKEIEHDYNIYDYFWLDTSLKRWKKPISNYAKN